MKYILILFLFLTSCTDKEAELQKKAEKERLAKLAEKEKQDSINKAYLKETLLKFENWRAYVSNAFNKVESYETAEVEKAIVFNYKNVKNQLDTIQDACKLSLSKISNEKDKELFVKYYETLFKANTFLLDPSGTKLDYVRNASTLDKDVSFINEKIQITYFNFYNDLNFKKQVEKTDKEVTEEFIQFEIDILKAEKAEAEKRRELQAKIDSERELERARLAKENKLKQQKEEQEETASMISDFKKEIDSYPSSYDDLTKYPKLKDKLVNLKIQILKMLSFEDRQPVVKLFNQKYTAVLESEKALVKSLKEELIEISNSVKSINKEIKYIQLQASQHLKTKRSEFISIFSDSKPELIAKIKKENSGISESDLTAKIDELYDKGLKDVISKAFDEKLKIEKQAEEKTTEVNNLIKRSRYINHILN